MLRNTELRIAIWVSLALMLVTACLLQPISTAAMLITLFTQGMLLTIYLLLSRYRYAQLKKLSMYLQQVYQGDGAFDIPQYREGELSILHSDLYKITRTLQLQKESLQKDKLFLADSLSDISHQLKTPLAALNIYNGILQEEAVEYPTIKEFVDFSEQELDRIETLVRNLLKITKLDSGTIVLEKKAENISEMMSKIESHFSYRAEQEEKNFSLFGDDTVTLLCDHTWMMEAVSNIVKNAFDHTEKGNTISVEWKQSASVVQIIVKDNGSGIHPEDLHYIFKRFYRSRFSKDTQGIGLGLSLAKAIVEAHSGTIEVDSELGAGTTFTLSFLIPTKL